MPLLAVAALSGCVAAPHGQPDVVVYRTMAHAVNVSTWQPCEGYAGDGDLAGAGAQTPSRPYSAFSVYDAAAHLTIPANVSSIILDLWWDHGVTSGIRSQAIGPNGNETLSAAQANADLANPVRLRFDHPAPGNWEWTGVADPVAAGVVLHFNEGLYYESPESLSFICNAARAGNGG